MSDTDEIVEVTIEGEVLERIKYIAMAALEVAGDWDSAAAHCEAAKQLCEKLRDTP